MTWTLLTGIACAASFADGQIAGGVLLACATLEVFSVVVFGFRAGNRSFQRLDVICQLAALIGLALWLMFNSPAVAVMAAIAIDLVGSVPTIRHSWLKPHEETWVTFGLSSLGGACTVLVAGSWRITAIAYPLYIVVANVLLVAAILGSPHRHVFSEPAELRDL